MTTDIDQLLGDFGTTDYSVRLVRGVCHVVPFAPELDHWFCMVDGLKAMAPDAKKDVLDRAVEISRGEDAQRALWLIKSLDTADSGISVFSGVRSAYKMYQAANTEERIDALETDTQQAVDAVLKGLATAFVIHKIYSGGIADKVDAFRKSQTGQAWIFYYAAIEVGLPFADNALVGGGSFLKSLFDTHQSSQLEKLAAVAGEQEAEEARSLMAKLLGPMETMVGMASEHLTPVANAASEFIPKAMNVGDKVAGVAATGADVLPVYRFLGSRLVAEACLRRALEDVGAAAEHAISENPANVAIKYTRSAQDLPDAPVRRRGCFGLWVALLALGGTLAGVLGSVL